MKKSSQNKQNRVPKKLRRRKQSSKFGENLHNLLQLKGWTHAEAAKLAQVSQATITSWINGRAQPYDYDCVLRLAEAGGVDFTELLTGKKRATSGNGLLPQKLPDDFVGFEVDDVPQFEGAYWISVKKIRKKRST